jgi:hypothetical protein
MPTIEQIISEQQRQAADHIKKSLPADINSVVEDIKKAKRAQLGEVREWSGVKMRKEAQGWVPVKEGNKTPKQEEGGQPKEAATPEALADHATKASEAALVNATKQSTDPAVRQAAHKELQRRKNEEAQDTFKAPDEGKQDEIDFEEDKNAKKPENNPTQHRKDVERGFDDAAKDQARNERNRKIAEEKEAAEKAKKEEKPEPKGTYSELSDEDLQAELKSEEEGSGAYKKIQTEIENRKLGSSSDPTKKKKAEPKGLGKTKSGKKISEKPDAKLEATYKAADHMDAGYAILDSIRDMTPEQKDKQGERLNAEFDRHMAAARHKAFYEGKDIKKSVMTDKEAIEMAAKFQELRKEGKTQGEALREIFKHED